MAGKIRISLADLEAYAKKVEEGIAFAPSEAQIKSIAGPDTGVTSPFHTQLERATGELAHAVSNARNRLTNLHTALLGTIEDMGAADQAALDDAWALASALEGMTTAQDTVRRTVTGAVQGITDWAETPTSSPATGTSAGKIG